MDAEVPALDLDAGGVRDGVDGAPAGGSAASRHLLPRGHLS